MFCFLKPLNSNKGTSITGALVGLAISGIIVSTILTTVTMGWGQIAQQEGRANRALLVEDIKSELSDAERCKLALTPQNTLLTPNNVSPIKMKFANGTMVGAGTSLKNYNLDVKSLKFFSRLRKTISPSQTSHYGDLVLIADINKGKAIDFAEKSVGKMTVVVNKSNAIVECNMGFDDFAEVCQKLGGKWDGEECKLPSSLLAMEEVCVGLGGKWTGTACEMPTREVASQPTPTPSPTPKPSPTPSLPTCFDRSESVTWCTMKCEATKDSATERWTLIKQVSGPTKASAATCPKVGYTSSCRYKVTCK